MLNPLWHNKKISLMVCKYILQSYMSCKFTAKYVILIKISKNFRVIDNCLVMHLL